MALNLTDCIFQGPALSEPFVKFELENELTRHKLLPKTTGTEGRHLQQEWDVYRRKLRDLAASGGSLRVRNHVIEPLLDLLGYTRFEEAPGVQTREDIESGGTLLLTEDGAAKLRVWTTAFNEDLYAPSKRGRAYRFSHLRIAQRVLLTTGERLGILTNGVQLLLLLSDPARPDSTVAVPLDPDWKRSRDMPDSFRLFLALASPQGVAVLPDIVEKARLQQARVTKELRVQARQAVERFIQEVLDHPVNRDWFASHPDRQGLAKELWREGLILVYRLLFILKLESSDDPARSFSFASTSLWRNSFSPSMALARYAREVFERGAETGALLETGLKSLFRMFEAGLECTELVVKPMGGALFGPGATPLLTNLAWGERAVAHLLDRLLWTPKRRGADTRERVHYGPLDVEDLGRVYEALLELEPGISSEPMCRLRRQKLEVVVPIAQGEKYKPKDPASDAPDPSDLSNLSDPSDLSDETDAEEPEDDTTPQRGKKTKVEWIEAIPPDRFFLRVGLGRKTTGSYYTPHSFVRFLVQETLGPLVAERSPADNPNPVEILKLKVLDPSMGSGHFLVEVCRFLGEKLYEACRLCDEKALDAERRAETTTRDCTKRAQRDGTVPNPKQAKQVRPGGRDGTVPSTPKRVKRNGTVPSESAPADETELSPLSPEEEARHWRQRVIDLPDPDDEMLRYLPSHSPEGEASGFSQQRAEALCRRLVAVHCLYGVDKNPLAVELAKLSLWLESHAEGMPLTFLDHRLVIGDSLTGPFWTKLVFRPGNPAQPVENLFTDGLNKKFADTLRDALRFVGRLEASVGISVAEVTEKEACKAKLDQALLPFRIAAAAWSGGVMLGPEHCDDTAYEYLLESIGKTGALPERIESEKLRRMIALGLGVDHVPIERDALYTLAQSPACIPALPYDLTFPEVFFPWGAPHGKHGFHVVLGNPPWNKTNLEMPEYMGGFDFRFLEANTASQRTALESQFQSTPAWLSWIRTKREEGEVNTVMKVLHPICSSNEVGFGSGDADIFAPFLDRSSFWLSTGGLFGMVIPSALHVSQSLTQLRKKILHEAEIRSYFCYENKKSLFEIHKSWKFTPLVLSWKKPDASYSFAAQFYLHDEEWLFSDTREPKPYQYSPKIIESMDPTHLIFQEFTSPKDIDCAKVFFANAVSWLTFCVHRNWYLRRELHATDDRWRIQYDTHPNRRDSNTTSFLIHHQPGTIHQYTDLWEGANTSAVPIVHLGDKRRVIELARFYRAVFRTTARATDERTSIYALLPPGTTATNSLLIEGKPEERCNALTLTAVSVCNSFSFDWGLRLRVGSKTVSKFIMEVTPFPHCVFEETSRYLFCAHNALRLSGNHGCYRALWHEQIGNAWREPKPSFTWPVLEGDDERWSVRAAIDAVVADAYGLNQHQYAHVLSTFSHKSYPKAPELCLARFDELKDIGLEAFTRKYDPYWDIPLNENLPQPVIKLPIHTQQDDAGALLDFDYQEIPRKRKRT